MVSKFYYFISAVIVLVQCTAVKITSSENDTSLILQNVGENKISISSLNSSQKVRIINREMSKDTLLVDYSRGIYKSSNNIIVLTPEIRIVKIARNLYEVRENEGKISIKEMVN